MASENYRRIRITAPELETLKGILQGMTAQEIAAVLQISSGTVDIYWRFIYQKFKATNRLHLIEIIRDAGGINSLEVGPDIVATIFASPGVDPKDIATLALDFNRIHMRAGGQALEIRDGGVGYFENIRARI